MILASCLPDGSESFVNRRTGARYLITPAHRNDGQWSVYAEGQFLRRTSREGAIALIEGLME